MKRLLAALLVCSCASARTAPDAIPTASLWGSASGPEALQLALEDDRGQRVELAEHRGVAVLVLAITTDHLPSQATLRALERVARRHPEGLFAVAMVGDNIPREAVRTVLASYRAVADLQRVTLTLASEDVRAGTSPLGPIERVPTMFFLNRVGALSRKVEGLMTEAQIEALVAPAIPSGM